MVAESLTDIITSAQTKYQFSHIIAPSTKFGSNFFPRVAAKLNSSPVSDVISIIDSNTFVRPMYAGNVLVTVQNVVDHSQPDAVQMLTVRGTAFEKAKCGESREEPLRIESLETTFHSDPQKTTFVSANVSKSNRPDLSSASIVVRKKQT
jgi:electron transfer flavoprotein alpha subunit